jgi:hypothetical protein
MILQIICKQFLHSWSEVMMIHKDQEETIKATVFDNNKKTPMIVFNKILTFTIHPLHMQNNSKKVTIKKPEHQTSSLSCFQLPDTIYYTTR